VLILHVPPARYDTALHAAALATIARLVPGLELPNRTLGSCAAGNSGVVYPVGPWPVAGETVDYTNGTAGKELRVGLMPRGDGGGGGGQGGNGGGGGGSGRGGGGTSKGGGKLVSGSSAGGGALKECTLSLHPRRPASAGRIPGLARRLLSEDQADDEVGSGAGGGGADDASERQHEGAGAVAAEGAGAGEAAGGSAGEAGVAAATVAAAAPPEASESVEPSGVDQSGGPAKRAARRALWVGDDPWLMFVGDSTARQAWKVAQAAYRAQAGWTLRSSTRPTLNLLHLLLLLLLLLILLLPLLLRASV